LRVLLVSDIHGNLEALRAVVEDAGPFDDVVVLGDLVDYGPRPGEVVDEVKGLGARVVRGNHDHAVAYGVDCRCGEDTHWLSVWFRENVTQRLVGDDVRAYLGRLPLSLNLDLGPFRALAVHGAPSNPLYAYLHPWLPDEEVCRNLGPTVRLTAGRRGACPKGAYLVGHTHHQFARTVQGALVVNPGSVGQPRDGDPRAAYALVDAERGSVELRRVKYDVDRVARELEALGIPEPYLSALKFMLYKARVPPRPPRGTRLTL